MLLNPKSAARRLSALPAVTLLLSIIFIGACQPSGQFADTVLQNGNVVTLSDSLGEQTAIAFRDGKILAVGSDADIAGHVGESTHVIDLAGRTVVPGFIEGHGHFMGLGASRLMLDLTTPTSWDEIVALVADAVAEAEPGEVIHGRGWHQDKWTSVPNPSLEGFPMGHDLSAVSPNNPVILTHASGHATFVNQAALDAAGITNDTPNPDGGEILREANGRAIGLLRETASDLVDNLGSELTQKERMAYLRKVASVASEELLAKGVTSFQDAGVVGQTVDLYKSLIDEGALPIRIWAMLYGTVDDLDATLAKYRTVGYGDNNLTVRAIKLSMDGALGSRGAWMLEPYSDARNSTGLNLIPVDYVRSTATLAKKHDYQLCVHAIGDRANREVLDVYAEAFAGESVDRRWRIEHAQHLSLSDIPRFAELNVIASMQAVHTTSDGPWVPDRIGDKRAEEGAYVWQKLMQSGAIVTNGTDVPVEDVDPIANYYDSVTRVMANGESFYPDQRMTRIEGLKAYTINNAYGAFEEDIKGTLDPGKLGDVVVLSQDILTVPDDQLLDTTVDYTIIGGKVLYSRQ